MYISVDDLILRFGEAWLLDVSDRDDDGQADQVVIDAAIRDADMVIDAKLCVLYRVPLASPPEIIRRISCQLARYFLSFTPTENVNEGYRDAIKTLDDIRSGKLPIDASRVEAPPSVFSGVRVLTAPKQAVLTDENLMGY